MCVDVSVCGCEYVCVYGCVFVSVCECGCECVWDVCVCMDVCVHV